jgi:hypothetical protein
LIKVRFISGWGCELSPILKKHTPHGSSQWRDVLFTEDDDVNSDYIIVLNSPPRDMNVIVHPDRLWCGIGEPDIGFYSYLHKDRKEYARVYGCDEDAAKKYENYKLSIPIMDRWKINRSYDFLSDPKNSPVKTKTLSWITSNKLRGKGHKQRIQFLQKLQESNLKFDLYGRGFNYVQDKWDAIAPYRYSIVFENHRSNYYWTEKLADAFVCETMPIYIGCMRIDSYFPVNSLVVIDPDDRDVIKKIDKIINSDFRERNIELILKSKDLALNKYNMLQYFASQVEHHSALNPICKKHKIKIRKARAPYPHWVYDYNMLQWPYHFLKAVSEKIKNRL